MTEIHSNYFKSVYCISGENCFTALLDDPALDDFNVGEFDRFSGEIIILIRQILNNFLYQFCWLMSIYSTFCLFSGSQIRECDGHAFTNAIDNIL